MRRSITRALAMGIMCAVIIAALTSRRVAAADDEKAAPQLVALPTKTGRPTQVESGPPTTRPWRLQPTGRKFRASH
jgi:hypothetical protein